MKKNAVSTLPPGAESSVVMYIGALARHTGTSPKAIRLYESLGLLGRVRRQGNYRVYTHDSMQRVKLIRQALSLGLRLSELGPVLDAGHGEPDWPALLQQLALKRARLSREMQAMKQLQARLQAIEKEIQTCLLQSAQNDQTA